MKKLTLTILLLVTTLLTPTLIFASGGDDETSQPEVQSENSVVDLESESTVTSEGDTTTVTNKYFDLVLIRKAQLPFGKKVPYEIQITSHIDSERTQILWEVPTTLEVNPRHSEFVSIAKDETRTYKANITPKRMGTYVVSVNVVSWQHDTNYTNSVKDTLVFDQDLVLQPVSDAYRVGNILKIFVIFVLCGIVLFLGYYFTKKSIPMIKKWLTPPM